MKIIEIIRQKRVCRAYGGNRLTYLGKKSAGVARYHHPDITVDDIISTRARRTCQGNIYVSVPDRIDDS